MEIFSLRAPEVETQQLHTRVQTAQRFQQRRLNEYNPKLVETHRSGTGLRASNSLYDSSREDHLRQSLSGILAAETAVALSESQRRKTLQYSADMHMRSHIDQGLGTVHVTPRSRTAHSAAPSPHRFLSRDVYRQQSQDGTAIRDLLSGACAAATEITTKVPTGVVSAATQKRHYAVSNGSTVAPVLRETAPSSAKGHPCGLRYAAAVRLQALRGSGGLW